MTKLLIIGLTSAALLTSINVSGALAQVSDPPPATADTKSPPAVQADRSGPSDNQIANDVDARIALLKADLRLTPEQEGNWSGLQTALHDDGVGQFKNALSGRSARTDRDAQSRRDDHLNDIALMRNEADQLNAKAASLKKLADAAEPLYGSLDDRQRHKLVQFMRSETERR